MDTVALVENQIEDGQSLLAKLAEKRFNVRAACWVKPVEEDRWSLYIVTPVLEARGPLEAYRELVLALRSLGEVSITTSDVKLVGEKHPMTRDALEILRRYPHHRPIRPLQDLFGDRSVEEVYVYPLRQVEVKIFGSVYRGEPNGALHLALEPHNPQSWLEIEGRRYEAEIGIDWTVAAPEGATLERGKYGEMNLIWDFRGKRTKSSANEVWSLAKLGLHGFRFLKEPA